VAGAFGLPRPALVQTRRKIKIAFGVPTLESCDSAFFSSIPEGAGFFADEGLDVEILPLNGAGAAMSMLAAGQAQFTTHGAAGVLAGVGQGVPIRAFIVQVPDNFYSIGVLADGPIQRVEDLKGQVVGVPALGGSPYVLLKAVFRQLGWDPNTDVTYQAVGVGMPALDALQRGRVMALIAWDAPFATYQANGAKLRFFEPNPLPQVGFTHSTNTTPATIEKDPALVAAMSRAMARSLVFMAAAEPEELARLHSKIYPAARSPGISDAMFFKTERMRLEARRSHMRFQQRVFSHTEKLGDETDARIAIGRDLLFQGGEIKAAEPVDRYFTRQFLPEINSIDFDGIIAHARSFKA
jgi:NitT/TauT family transport system substrate-binding protein